MDSLSDDFALSNAEDYFPAADEQFELSGAGDYFPLSESPSAAYHAVLFTAELLERILFKLDTRTLLLTQKVSTFWRNTVRGSQLLQRALFYRSEQLWYTRYIPASDGSHISTSALPFGEGCVPRLMIAVSSFYLNATGREPLLQPVANPLLPDALTELFAYKSAKTGWSLQTLAHHKAQNSSWRKMLLTQPAVTGMFLNYRSDYIKATYSVFNGRGVTAGDVADELEKLMRRLGSRTISVKSIVGEINWQRLEDNSQIEAVVDDVSTILPPSQGLNLNPEILDY